MSLTPQDIVNKTVLIGLTILNEQGEVDRREQFSGTIRWVSEETIHVELDDGEDYTLPPDLDALHPAAPGVYTLKGSGKKIENPDFLTSWTITPPQEEDDEE